MCYADESFTTFFSVGEIDFKFCSMIDKTEFIDVNYY